MTDVLGPLLPFGEPEQPVVLFEGSAQLQDEAAVPVRIWLSLERSVSTRWEVTESHHDFGTETCSLTFEHERYGQITVPAEVEQSRGAGTINACTVGSSAPVASVTCQLINMPQVWGLSERSRPEGSAHSWTVNAAGWTISVVPRPDLHSAEGQRRTLRKEFLLTHTATLHRCDGAAFAFDEGLEALITWQLALSFACGRWVGLACPAGHDDAGIPVTEQWAPWRCDSWRGYLHWWRHQRGDDLVGYTERFVDRACDPNDGPVVRHLAKHAISANHSGTTVEGRLMLAQAGLEFLAWNDLVLDGPLSKRTFDRLPADEKLRTLLLGAGIPTSIPPELDALTQSATEERCADAPEALTRVRNRIVHPKDPDEPYRIDYLIWQATLLQLEYLELLTLHRVGYTGSYVRRYPPGAWPTATPVPWAARESAS